MVQATVVERGRTSLGRQFSFRLVVGLFWMWLFNSNTTLCYLYLERCYVMCFLSVMAAGHRGGVVARHGMTGLGAGGAEVGAVGMC